MKLLKLLFWPGRMGFMGGDGGDGGAAEARRAEEERQAKITEGTNRVNELFGGPVQRTRTGSTTQTGQEADPTNRGEHGTPMMRAFGRVVPTTETYTENVPGQFNDEYFGNIGQAFRDYYLPQVDQQYQDAVRAIKVGSPSLNSSAFARKEGKLSQDYERSKADVADRALSAEGEARGNVETSRNSILSAVRAGAGAEEAAASATNALRSLKAPPVYSPIGDLFTRYLNTAANATVADNMGYQQTPLSLNTLFRRPGSAISTVNN